MNQHTPAKQRILLKAHELFYREGIHATGINQIIGEAKVTKVTFYRHFSSKNVLVLAFLDYRHQLWSDWFRTTLKQSIAQSNPFALALSKTLKEWMNDADYRGCAFINTAAEIRDKIPEVKTVICQHKKEMVAIIHECLSVTGVTSDSLSKQIGMVVDGAIVMAQRGEDINEVGTLVQVTCEQLIKNAAR